MLREAHPSDDIFYHALSSIGGNRVRPSSRRVTVARPPRQVDKVLPLCGLVYLELDERRSVRSKDDVVETRSMWPNLFHRKPHPQGNENTGRDKKSDRDFSDNLRAKEKR